MSKQDDSRKENSSLFLGSFSSSAGNSAICKGLFLEGQNTVHITPFVEHSHVSL